MTDRALDVFGCPDGIARLDVEAALEGAQTRPVHENRAALEWQITQYYQSLNSSCSVFQFAPCVTRNGDGCNKSSTGTGPDQRTLKLAECSHGAIKECRVIETLANNDQYIHGQPRALYHFSSAVAALY